jgi:hypothetical protein
LLPILYLRGVSAGDFQEALAALLGKTRRTCRVGDRAAEVRMGVFKLNMAAAKTWRRLKAKTSCRKSSPASPSKTASR